MKDEIAQEIANELRLIREELRDLAMAVRSKGGNSENFNARKARKTYQPQSPYSRDQDQVAGSKPNSSARPGQPRRQWHQNFPKDK